MKLRRVKWITDRALVPLEDMLIRRLANLGAGGILLLVAITYVLIAIALPLAVHASRPELIVLGAAGAICAWAITLMWAGIRVEARERRHLLEWTTELRHLDAEEFEWLVGELLRREGWQVEETGIHGAPDGNVDIRARRDGVTRLVQCKCWKRRKVGVREVRELGGTLLREDLVRGAGMLVTLSRFTPHAVEEAATVGITLVDGAALLERIHRVRRTESCPHCGTPMALSKSEHGWWLRCPQYPACAGKRDLGSAPGPALELLLAS